MLFAAWELLSIDEILILVLVVLLVVLITAIAYVRRRPLRWVPEKYELQMIVVLFVVALLCAGLVFCPVTYVPKGELKVVEGKLHSVEIISDGKNSSHMEIFLNDKLEKNGFRPLSRSIARSRVEDVEKGEPVKLLIGEDRVYEMQSNGKIIFGYQECVDYWKKVRFYQRCVAAVVLYFFFVALMEAVVRKILRKRLLKSESV